MKKFFEKYDLIKLSGILVLISAILTWILPYSYFSGTELVSEEIKRIGITNFFQFGLLGMYYFTVLVTFLFVMGGFYQVLSKRAGYQKLIGRISEKLKGKEIPTVLFLTLIFAILGSMVSEYFPLLAIIPFIVSILNRLKIDKISSFVATFGGLLIGAIGSTYSTKVTGAITEIIKVETADILTYQTIIFVVSFILLSIFTVLRMKKKLGEKKFEEYDRFEIEVSTKTKDSKNSVRMWPYALLMIVLFIILALAYLPWETWQVTLFTDITKWVSELSIGGAPIVSYIFGEILAFGKWDIHTIQYIMIVATLFIHWFGKMSFDEVCESYGEGFKKISSTVLVMLMVYFILEITVMFPVVPSMIDWLDKLVDGFNVFITFIGAFITSIFSVEMQYAISLAGTYYAAAYTDALPAIAIIFQTAFGFVSFFVPSSAILMIGLSYLDIPYKEWMKFIWKFLLAILAVIIVIILVIA